MDNPSGGTSVSVLTPALRIALSPLESAAAARPASARDAATGTARISNRLRWESIGAPYRPARRGIVRGPRGQPASRFAPERPAEWGGRAAAVAANGPEWRDPRIPHVVVDGVTSANVHRPFTVRALIVERQHASLHATDLGPFQES